MTARRRPSDDASESLIGHYAGAVTRLVAFVVDSVIVLGLYQLGVFTFIWLVHVFTGNSINEERNLWFLIPLYVWQFTYYWYCYALSGRTPGKAFFGLRVVRGDGRDLRGGRAALRVLTFPLGWLGFGLGFIGIVIGRHRRGIYDVIADTAVVYDFDARAAHLRFLVRHPVIELEPAASATDAPVSTR